MSRYQCTVCGDDEKCELDMNEDTKPILCPFSSNDEARWKLVTASQKTTTAKQQDANADLLVALREAWTVARLTMERVRVLETRLEGTVQPPSLAPPVMMYGAQYYEAPPNERYRPWTCKGGVVTFSDSEDSK